jgi:hypothetical protein
MMIFQLYCNQQGKAIAIVDSELREIGSLVIRKPDESDESWADSFEFFKSMIPISQSDELIWHPSSPAKFELTEREKAYLPIPALQRQK